MPFNKFKTWNMLYSLGTPASSTNKTDCHDMTEILLKVVLNAINLNLEYEFRREWFVVENLRNRKKNTEKIVAMEL